MIAPPTPTTTPITIDFVFDDMSEDEVVLSEFRDATPVDLVIVVEVEDETAVVRIPETVMTLVTNTTLMAVDSEVV